MGILRDRATGHQWRSIPNDVRVMMLEVDKAIGDIAPFLAASLETLPEGHDGTYEAACMAIFKADGVDDA